MAGTRRVSTSRRWSLAAVLCIAVGAGLRIAYAVRCGVGYDEVFVMGIGVDELFGPWRAFFIEVPIRRSDGVTPLWWWVQAVPSAIGGHLSLVGLRVVPVVLGIATLVLTWRVAAPRIGRGPTAILVALAAVSDVLAFSDARGEFAEPLLIMVALPAACLVGQPRRGGLKGVLWLVLLMTHLGKGLLLVAGLIMAEGVSAMLRPGRSETRRSLRSLLLAAAIAVVPTLAWLVLVNTVAFSSGPLATDAGDRDSVWQALGAITVGYRQTKMHLVGGRLDAVQVYLDGVIWPATTVLAVPLLVGLVAVSVLAARRALPGRRWVLALSLFPWIAAGLAAVIGRGMLGGRFHLLYLPAVWIVAAVGLWRLRHAGRATILGCGLLWMIHLAVAFSWSSWTERTLAVSSATPAAAGIAVATVAAALLGRGRRRPWRPAAAILGLSLIGALLLSGPGRWGPAARFEPLAGPTDDQERNLLAVIDQWRSSQADFPAPHGRTLYIDLANYFLRKDPASAHDLQRALHYAELETNRDPNDARGWFYLGLTRQRQERPTDEIREAWERAYDLRPDPRLAERLENLRE